MSNSQPIAASAIDFLLLLQKLKTTKRTGWVRKDVHKPESIADHMYRMGVMALIAGDCGVSADRAIRLALVHDVAESVVGDITPYCGVTSEDKHAMEAKAMEDIRDMLGGATGAEVMALWREYEEAATPEAQLVKDFDKLEMIIQAYEYEGVQPTLDLEEFFTSTAGKFKTATGRAWAEELISRRKVRLAGSGSSNGNLPEVAAVANGTNGNK